nr:hypothetical protein [uncultured Niameybacter sp.]
MNTQGWIRGLIAHNVSAEKYMKWVCNVLSRELLTKIDVSVGQDSIMLQIAGKQLLITNEEISTLQKRSNYALDRALLLRFETLGIKVNPSQSQYLNYCVGNYIGAIIQHQETGTLNTQLNKEYLNKIAKFTNITDTDQFINIIYNFMLNYRCYPNVFTDAGIAQDKKLKEKRYLNYSDDQKFISIHRLETFLQKVFYKDILEGLNESYGCIGRLDETHGIVLMHFTMCKGIEINNNLFETALQIQNRTIKFVIQAVQYERSTTSMLTSEIIKYMNYQKGKNDFNRVNLGLKHAYISLTKRLDKEVYEYTTEELQVIYTRVFSEVRTLSTEFINQLQK